MRGSDTTSAYNQYCPYYHGESPSCCQTNGSDAVRYPVPCAELVSKGVRETERAWMEGRSESKDYLSFKMRGANLYFSSLSGQRLIHDAIWSFWRTATSCGSALDLGRYVKRSASAA